MGAHSRRWAVTASEVWLHIHTQNIVFQSTVMSVRPPPPPRPRRRPADQRRTQQFGRTSAFTNHIHVHQYEARLSRLGCVIIMRLPFSGIGLGAAISFPIPCHLIHSSQNNISTTIVFPVDVTGEEQKY